MNSSFVKHIIFPLIAAFIWGTAFVAMSLCAGRIPPFTCNAIRYSLAFIALLIVGALFRAKGIAKEEGKNKDKRKIIAGGIATGCLLAAATCMQQAAMAEATAARGGFLTTLYVVLVPVFAVFVGKKPERKVRICVLLAGIGLYYLCIPGGENLFSSFKTSDALLVLCSAILAVHVLVVDYYVQYVDGVLLSTLQFFFAALTSALLALLFEEPDPGAVASSILPLLYLGVVSSGVGFTLQVLSQDGANPTLVTLLYSLENVIAVAAGAVLLHQMLSGRELFGCALMLIAVLLAQIPSAALMSAVREKDV